VRVFILYANPVATSFGAALHMQVVASAWPRDRRLRPLRRILRSGQVMSEHERVEYHDPTINKPHFADRLLAADALVLVYPVWNKGFPAILKGFFDRVFIPGVSFRIGPDGAATPNLQKLKKLAAVCTYGADRLSTLLLGDPPKRVVKRLVRSMPGHAVRCDYLAHYDMNDTTPERRGAFLKKVKLVLESLVRFRRPPR
jgi:NAD(P)H dehydrogenase (quinone)